MLVTNSNNMRIRHIVKIQNGSGAKFQNNSKV